MMVIDIYQNILFIISYNRILIIDVKKSYIGQKYNLVASMIAIAKYNKCLSYIIHHKLRKED